MLAGADKPRPYMLVGVGAGFSPALDSRQVSARARAGAGDQTIAGRPWAWAR